MHIGHFRMMQSDPVLLNPGDFLLFFFHLPDDTQIVDQWLGELQHKAGEMAF